METENERAVLVTTKHRGVFFGFVNGDELGRTVTLKRCRNCIFWHESVGGFLGLAKHGPNDSCRIGSESELTQLWDVTSVSEVTDEARERWCNAPSHGVTG